MAYQEALQFLRRGCYVERVKLQEAVGSYGFFNLIGIDIDTDESRRNLILPEPLGPANTLSLGIGAQAADFYHLADDHFATRPHLANYLSGSICLRSDNFAALDMQDGPTGRKRTDIGRMGGPCSQVRYLTFKVLNRFFGQETRFGRCHNASFVPTQRENTVHAF